MDKTEKKRTGLKEATALIQKRDRLRNPILIAIFSAAFTFLFEVLFQVWLEGKSLQMALSSFSWYKVISTVVFWFFLYYFLNPQFETERRTRKRAERKQLGTEASG